MCGRYTWVNLHQFTDALSWITPPADVPPPRYNVAPMQDVPVVVGTDPGRVEPMRWGLVPSWATDPAVGNKMINARAETLADRPAFRGPLQAGRRCLVPVDGFYEWSKAAGHRTPYRVRLASRQPFALAGLWDEWRDPAGGVLRTCTIVTTEPNDVVRPLHSRMAVVLRPEFYRRWLARCPLPPAEVGRMLAPYPADEMEAYPVSAAVGDVRVDRPELIDEVVIESPPAEPQLSLFG